MYQRDYYRNSRHSGAIGLLMVCGSIVLVQGQFRRQISTESCYRVGSQGILVTTVIGFVAAANTSSSFFLLIALLV